MMHVDVAEDDEAALAIDRDFSFRKADPPPVKSPTDSATDVPAQL